MKRRTIVFVDEQEEKKPPAAAAAAVAVEQDTTTATDADSLFAKALTNLSFNDRTTIENEIHGVSCIATEETPELLAHSLIAFEAEIHNIHPKPAYDKVQQELLLSNNNSSSISTTSYIHTNTFRLRFLRCELFHVRKAAERYLKYLDFVGEVYGDYALQRHIKMSDLTRDEMAFLREGLYQILPYRDQSGRRIITIVSKEKHSMVTSKRSLLRVHFYLFSACAGGCDTTNNDFNNIESQQKGGIVVYFPNHLLFDTHGEISQEQRESQKNRIVNQGIIAALVPIRLTCVHLCLPNTQVYRITGKIIGMALAAWNARTKIHLGNPIEWRYALQAYGIPTEIIPSTDTGNIKLENLRQWIRLKMYTEQQFTQESTMTASMKTTTTTPVHRIVECPGSHDVIFKRGKSMNYHPGNVMFQNLIESRIQQHSIDPNSTEAQKYALELEVIQQVQQEGGRFLKWEIEKGWWMNISVDNNIPVDRDVDVDTDISRSPTIMNTKMLNINTNNATSTKCCSEVDSEIQLKVHNAFRDFRKKMLRAQQKQLQFNAPAAYAFERQDGQKKRQRSSNSNTTSCTTMTKVGHADDSVSSGSDSITCVPFLPDMGGDACGYFFPTT